MASMIYTIDGKSARPGKEGPQMLACPELLPTEPSLLPLPERAAWYSARLSYSAAPSGGALPARGGGGPLQRHCVVLGSACVQVGVACVLRHLIQGRAAGPPAA